MAHYALPQQDSHRSWYLVVSPGLTQADWSKARIAAAYSQWFTTENCFPDEKNDPDEGFHLDYVTLSTPREYPD